MARLAGSPVPVPTTLRSTAGSMALKPGPSRVLWTSTTLTSAPMATLSRVCAVVGAARARAAARTTMILTSMGWLLSGMFGTREDSQPAGGNLDLDGTGLRGRRAVDQQDRIAHPHVVAIVRAQEEALLEDALEGGDGPVLGHGVKREIGRARDHEHGPRERPGIRQDLIAHAQAPGLGHGVEPVGHAEEVRGEGARRLEIDLLRCALLHDLARVHQDHAVGDGEGLLLIVRDVDHGGADPALEPADFHAQPLADLGVEIGERLVEEQHARLHHDSARETHALPLAAREPGGLPLRYSRGVADLHEVEGGHDLAQDVRPREALAPETVRDVVEDAHVGPQGVVLEHHGRPARLGRQRGDVVATKENATSVDGDEARDGSEQRGLPAAGWAQDGGELARAELERHSAERLHLAKALRDRLDADGDHATDPSTPLRRPLEEPGTCAARGLRRPDRARDRVLRRLRSDDRHAPAFGLAQSPCAEADD